MDDFLGYLGIGQYYYVHPEYSLKFSGRKGQIVVIDKGEEMPYGLVFEGDSIPYFFAREELLSEKEFYSIFGGE